MSKELLKRAKIYAEKLREYEVKEKGRINIAYCLDNLCEKLSAAQAKIDELLSENEALKLHAAKPFYIMQENGKAVIESVVMHDMKNKIKEIEAQNKVMVKALEFYANRDDWSYVSKDSPWMLLFNSSCKDGHGYETALFATSIKETK